VEHVHTFRCPALGLAGCAGQLHAQECEDGHARQPIPHLHQAGVEVDLARQGADGQQGGVAHDQERRDGLLPGPESDQGSSDDDMMQLPDWASAHVKESWVDIGSLLEDNDVSSGPLCRGNLPENRGHRVSKEDMEWDERFWHAVRIL
jgi:hypothetical protein